MQGCGFSPMIAAAQVDDIARSWEDSAGSNIYKYRDSIKIGILGFLDDQLGVSVQGIPAHNLNSHINTKTGEKGLQFSSDGKCVQMNIRSKGDKSSFCNSYHIPRIQNQESVT